ncbi:MULTISPECIES: sensor histidine kinase [Aurantimonas]|jgi:PAS domain S-box-containing protein|uniref:Blue-light-activated histidine kinase n=1 Tax=Aurantimonas coralicida TaxID=182270 RepID=A0A0P0YYI8_9HYPH|nr:HWE histidine kinase domain-containing protein [Aurantimonas coralicida]BAT26654.1 sensory box protein [Aurantimonas coralicida]
MAGPDRSQSRSRQAREAWLSTIIEAVPALLWAFAADGRWSWASPQWVSYTGLDPAEDRRRGWLEAVHPEDRETALAASVPADEPGRAAHIRMLEARTGSYRWFKIMGSALPVPDPDNTDAPAWLVTATDVDDLQNLRNEQRRLLAELQHRVRNNLANIRSIVRRTGETSASVTDFAGHLEGRLDALGRIQTYVARSPAGDVALVEIVAEEILAGALREGENVHIDGPSIRLPARIAEPLALAIHELTQNAIKYGPLMTPDGSVRVTWRLDDRDGTRWLDFEWAETGLRDPLPETIRDGFGFELLKRTLGYQIDAHTTIRLDRHKMECEISIPLGKA